MVVSHAVARADEYVFRSCGISVSGWITAMSGNFFSLLQSTIVTVFMDFEGIFSIL